MNEEQNIKLLMGALAYLKLPPTFMENELMYHIGTRQPNKFSIKIKSIHEQKDGTMAVVFHHLKFAKDAQSGSYSYMGRSAIRATPGNLEISAEDKRISDALLDKLQNVVDILPGERLADFSRRQGVFRAEVARELQHYRKTNPNLFEFLIGMVVPSTEFRLGGELHKLQQTISKRFVSGCFLPPELEVDLHQSDALLTGKFVYATGTKQWVGINMDENTNSNLLQSLILATGDFDPVAILSRHSLFEIDKDDFATIRQELRDGKNVTLPANHFAKSPVQASINPVEGSVELFFENGKPYAHLYRDQWLYHKTYKQKKADQRKREPGHRDQVTQRRGNKRHVEHRRQQQKNFTHHRKK